MPKVKDSSQDYIWGKRKNKTWLIAGISVGVVVLAVLGFFIFRRTPSTSNSNNSAAGSNTNSTALVRRDIDGVYVPADQAHYFPAAVMIENLVASRPASGLSKANLVYEALAEGGITRFMAVYAGNMSIPEIGPVRSARPYYLTWAQEYGALYAHVGGSPQALADIKTYGIFDLNQFYNSQYFWRSKDRPAPHNLYTSGEKLVFALRDKKAASQGTYPLWKFKDDAASTALPQTDKSVAIDFSSFNYKVEYKFDRATNSYVRYLAGAIQKDKDGSEIHAKNVIVQKVKTTLVDQERLGMDTVGEGEALLFRDGVAVQGRWAKKSRTDRTVFYDQTGGEAQFNAGTTWVEVVPTDRDIVYN